MSSLCLCLTESSYEGSLSQLNRYRPYIGMVEMRLDLLDPTERIKAADLPFTAGMPTILTVRLPDDGGNWGRIGETEDEREELFITFLRTGQWTYVDLEYNKLMEKVAVAANDAGTRIIRSRHDFKGTKLIRHRVLLFFA